MAQKQKLISFTNPLVTYTDFLQNVELHHELDKYEQGVYWNGERGCAVGCTLNTFIRKPEIKTVLRDMDVEIAPSNHDLFETLFGIPRIIARLQDRIFEGLPTEDAKEFPLQFAQAIKPGVNYSLVWYKFAEWLLLDSEHGVIRHAKTERTRDAINGVGALYQRHIAGDEPTIQEWRAAATAAAAAYAAAYAYADAAAAAAAYAAAYAYATAAAAAYAAARFIHYKLQRDKLLALLVEAGEQVTVQS